MVTNSGHAPKKTRTPAEREADFAAFDQLPWYARDILDRANKEFSAAQVLGWYRKLRSMNHSDVEIKLMMIALVDNSTAATVLEFYGPDHPQARK